MFGVTGVTFDDHDNAYHQIAIKNAEGEKIAWLGRTHINHIYEVDFRDLPRPNTIRIVEENVETAKIVAAKLALNLPIDAKKIPDAWLDMLYDSGLDYEAFVDAFF